MGQFFIIISTILVLLVIGERNARNNKRIFKGIKKIIAEIHYSYIDLFKEKSIFARIIQGSLLILAEVFITVAVSTTVIKYIKVHDVYSIDLAFKILVIIASLIVIHFAIGYVLLSTSKIHKFIYGVEDKRLKVDLLLSYFILSTYFTVLIVLPEQFNEAYVFGFVGVAICYVLNMKVLLSLIMNPHKVKGKDDDTTTFNRVIIAALLVVLLIVLNLFLATCFVNSAETGGAYTNSPNYFDLFYYTIITFTTVGYGDIAPVTILAKIVSIIISVTSVICVTIFVSSILSFRDKFKGD